MCTEIDYYTGIILDVVRENILDRHMATSIVIVEWQGGKHRFLNHHNFTVLDRGKEIAITKTTKTTETLEIQKPTMEQRES